MEKSLQSRPVLIVAGIGGKADEYTGISQELCKLGASTLVVGWSSFTRTPCWGENLIQLLDAAGISRIHVLTHSAGAVAVFDAALLRPDLFESIIVLDGPIVRPQPNFQAAMEISMSLWMMAWFNPIGMCQKNSQIRHIMGYTLPIQVIRRLRIRLGLIANTGDELMPIRLVRRSPHLPSFDATAFPWGPHRDIFTRPWHYAQLVMAMIRAFENGLPLHLEEQDILALSA